jgi:hypothetical protein
MDRTHAGGILSNHSSTAEHCTNFMKLTLEIFKQKVIVLFGFHKDRDHRGILSEGTFMQRTQAETLHT